MSPRKSSTSSGKRPPSRPRYLGIEVAGEHLPAFLSPRWWESTLRAALPPDERGTAEALRVIRSEGTRAVVEVDQFSAPRFRSAWNHALGDVHAPRFATRRTWGTLVGAKRWLRERRESPEAGRH